MLQLQRASAGSGKTFTLARKFIWYLIAIKEENGQWRLRSPREVTDGLPRILAITFTNKATNEMKQRIVEKLADLSRADVEPPLSDSEAASINYLDQFASELGVERAEIGRVARTALSALLNDYSDFKVSTIDSFFQTVLRTFAYESNLNDTYQVEIDNDYVAAAAVDATLLEIDGAPADSIPSFWLRKLMEEEDSKGSKHWNVFQKSPSDSSIYSRLLSSVKRLESEDFKNVRERLDAYFDTPDGSDPLQKAYATAVDAIERPAEEALEEARKAARELSALFRKNRLDPDTTAIRFMGGHLRKLPLLRVDDSQSKFFTPIKMEGKTSIFKTAGKKGAPVASSPDDPLMLDTASRMYEAYSRFLELREKPEWRHWKVYAPRIQYVGLIGATRRQMNEYLDANNSIQLGETNSMLRRIIGDDDAPFIYERLGSRLNHFLIDEFQDTSRLQWANLLPLLRESDSRGEDNLVIGDAKQSIYRFRNADPSLIMKAVPEAFPVRIDAGMSVADNTNWRSDRTVVEFNNIFFKELSARVAELGKDFIDFADLYSNVEQHASHRQRRGYIGVTFLEPPESGTDRRGNIHPLSSEEKGEALRKEALDRLGPLIADIMARGYRQSDIAVLVRTNSLAKEVIDTLVAYNTTLPEDERRIEFISEESLLVSSSDAVGIIISVLRKMAQGTHESPDKKDMKPKWSDIRCNFNFYALRHPELPTADQVKGFMSEESPADSINAMLSTMQTVALPALVEAITENFVPDDMRRSEAVFLAGLQDLVLEYTDSHAADVASFIDWWDAKGVTRSISSPEGTDAVQIMTIHKSKGLEFGCVIIPFDDSSIVPLRKSEWKWVEPEETFLKMGFPPYLPVVTDTSLEDTIHADVYRHFYDLSAMDMLNAYYVAFTRAVSELHIFTRLPSQKGRTSTTLGYFLHSILSDEELADRFPDGVRWNDAHDLAEIGTLPVITPAEARSTDGNSEAHGSDASDTIEHYTLDEYYVDSSPSVLQYVESDDDTDTATLLPDAEDTDPRSEGNLLHGIMSLVKTRSDLHRAILHYKTRGLISNAQAVEWEEMLGKAMDSPEVSRWFKPGWRVLNERDIIFPGMKNRRPDRMMIAPDKSHGVIIDYKFGDIPAGDSHKKQVEGYIQAFRETTHIHRVAAFIWYVRRNQILPLPS